MTEELKVGDRVDVPKARLTGNEKDAGQSCEDWGVITAIYATALLKTPNGLEKLLVEGLRKHKPKPKPGQLLRYKAGNLGANDKRFAAETLTTTGTAYWIYEYTSNSSQPERKRLAIEEASVMELAYSEQEGQG